MSLSEQEIAVWQKYQNRYDETNNCLNCGENFYAAHQPTCKWSDDCERLNTVMCGDCLRTDCKGCER